VLIDRKYPLTNSNKIFTAGYYFKVSQNKRRKFHLLYRLELSNHKIKYEIQNLNLI
jgi:hypothetical protein